MSAAVQAWCRTAVMMEGLWVKAKRVQTWVQASPCEWELWARANETVEVVLTSIRRTRLA